MDQAPLYQPKRCAIALMAIAAAYPFAQAGGEYGTVVSSSASGYYYGGAPSDITARAQARRNEQIQASMSALEKGREYYKDKKYEEALQEYNTALELLPKAPVTETRRETIIQHIGDASVAVAQQYRKVGRYDEAQQLLENALKINPNNKLAKQELAFLEDPIRSNPALNPAYVKDVEDVNKHLRMGYGYFDLGRYDEATQEFQKVLRIDKYNIAARRGMETVDRRRQGYYEAAQTQARGEALAAVTALWENTVPMDLPDVPFDQVRTVENPGVALNTTKLKNIILPRVDFEDTTVRDAIQFLRQRSVELDPTVGSGGERGINFILNDSTPAGVSTPAAPTLDEGFGDEGFGDEDGGLAAAPAPVVSEDIGSKKIKELKLQNVPMLEVLKFICQNAGLRYKIEDYAVSILPASGDNNDIHMRTFSVPGNFLSQLEATAPGGADGAGFDDPFATGGGSSSGLRARRSPIELFKLMGIPFNDGCSATYIASNSTLVVRNTMAALDMIEQTIEQVAGANKQIMISAKFVEITQENTDELSFDWVMTPMSINNGRSLFAGGANSTGTGVDGSDFVSNPGGVSGWPISSTSDTVNGLVTGGLRSGNGAISDNSLDSLLKAPNREQANVINRAPGIMSMTGIYDEGAFQMIMRGLSQKKGADVLTAPSILARPDQAASIEIIREFIYPTNYEPPQLPNNVGSTWRDNYNRGTSVIDGVTSALGSNVQPEVNSFPVTPATPTEFEMRPVGVRLNVVANVGQNDYVIDLEFKPELVEFEGFVNYGSPIQSTGVGSDGKPVSITLTENRIEQPIFSTRKVDTFVYIYDGYTVGIGGLITETVQTVEDKVPIFGDLPFVGRFFRGNSESHNKKNLMIFVTAKIVDATGQPIRGRSSSPLPTENSELSVPGLDSGILPPTP